MRRIAVKITAAIMTLVVMASVMVLPASALSSPPYEGYNYDPYGVSTAAPIGYLPDGTIDYEDMGLDKNLTSPQDMFVFDNKEIWISDSAGVDITAEATDEAAEGETTEDAVAEDVATEDATTEKESGSEASASTEYGRIVVLDTDFKLLREYTKFIAEDGTEEYIPSPQGLFIRHNQDTGKDEMFVCCNITVKDKDGNDRKDGYVVCADMDGNIIRKYTRPESSGTDIKDFQPLSVVVDDSNYLYLQAYGVLDGIIVYTYDKAEYESFYGANKVVLTWTLLVQQTIKKIFSRKATEGMLKAVPTEMSNMHIDDEGFIYTTTATSTVEKELRVRKLNAAGSNTLQADVNALVDVVFGDRETGSYVSGGQHTASDTRLEDIVVNSDGVMACMDVERSRIYLYDQTCMLLTAFGYKAAGNAVEGSVAAATAIEELDGRYLVLDSARGTIVTYRPTEYMTMLLEANRFYTDGRYVEGESYWRNVLKYDANFARGYAAIGKSLREQKDYQGSLYWLKQGQDRTSYSLALQEYRKEFLRDNYLWLVPAAVAACVAFVMLFRFIQRLLGIKRKKKHIKFS